jgi:hypothetical protein
LRARWSLALAGRWLAEKKLVRATFHFEEDIVRNKGEQAMGRFVVVVLVLAVLAGILVAGVCALLLFGWALYTDEVCSHVKELPGVQDKVGVVTSCTGSLIKSGDVADMDTFVFDVVGERASGRVYVKSTSDGPDGAEVYQGILLDVGGERTLVDGTVEPPTQ